MKIGLVSSHSFFRPGGVKSHILALQREFKKKGHYVKVIVPRREKLENYGKDIILLGSAFAVPFDGTTADFSYFLNSKAIEKFLKKEKFDILHFHNFNLYSWQILDLSRSTNILTFHACTTLKKIYASPWIKFFFPVINFLKKGESKTLREVIKENSSKMHGLIGVAPFNVELIKSLGYKGPSAVIPNGIDLSKFNPSAPKIQRFLDGKINILFVGRIEERKGLIYLLRAYNILKKKWPNVRLIVVGRGELKQECEEYVAKNKLQDVIFEGEIQGSQIPSYYTTADIYCAPSIFGESFGIVLLESMASGTPVVAFGNEGYKRVLTGMGARFLAKPRDYKMLAKKLEILIKGERVRKNMKVWGIKEAKKYSWGKIADRVLKFYELCTKERKEKTKLS